MASSPEAAEASMIKNLEDRTGHSLAEWIKRAKASGFSRHAELVTFLKTKHDLGHGYAGLVAHKALGSDAGSIDDEELVSAQFAGAKAALRPIYDTIIARLQKLGPDIELAPKKAYVSLRRSKQFGLLKPSTAARLDVGLVLKGKPAKGRLETSGSFNAMVTHRVRVEKLADVDGELMGWLKEAYEAG